MRWLGSGEGIEIPPVVGDGAPIVCGAFGTSIICLSARLLLFVWLSVSRFQSLFICGICCIHNTPPACSAVLSLYSSSHMFVCSCLHLLLLSSIHLSCVYLFRHSARLSIYSVYVYIPSLCPSARLSIHFIPLSFCSSVYSIPLSISYTAHETAVLLYRNRV